MGLPDRAKKLGIIHVAKKQCRLSDDDYRCLLESAAGVSSASKIDNMKQFTDVMKAFERLGFKKKTPGFVHIKNAQLEKCYMIWCELHDEGAVQSRSYTSMRQWIRRMFGDFDIMHVSQKSQAIEALKNWLGRVQAKKHREELGGKKHD